MATPVIATCRLDMKNMLFDKLTRSRVIQIEEGIPSLFENAWQALFSLYIYFPEDDAQIQGRPRDAMGLPSRTPDLSEEWWIAQ